MAAGAVPEASLPGGARSTSRTDEPDERLVDALREAAEARAILLSRLDAASDLHAKCAALTKQVMTLNSAVSGMRRREAELLSEVSALKDELAQRSNAPTGDAEHARLRAENAALKLQCDFLASETRTNLGLVAQSSRRASELSKMVSASTAPPSNNSTAG